MAELSKLKREFSLMWSEVEEEAKWKKMVPQSGIQVRGELIVSYYLIFTLYQEL